MKKTFPVIFTLIALSILGILFIQISWLQGLMILQKNQLSDKLNNSGVQVSTEIGKKMNSGLSFHFPKKGLGLQDDYHLHNFEETTISDIYTFDEVNKKIKIALDKYGLNDLHFEFAIADKKGNIEMKSKQFEDVFSDEVNALQARVPIIPSDIMEPTGPFETIIIVAPNIRYYLLRSLLWIIVGVVLFIIVVLAAFFITIRSLITQRKLVEIKRDFINNMTHELKTPLATISLAVDALRSSKVNSDPKSVEYFSNIIKEENVRMNKHVETILQAAQLDKKENELNKQEVDIHDLILGVVDSFKLQLEGKPSNVQTILEANPSLIKVDEEHLLHVLSNLIDNAIKYSKNDIDIIIKTKTLGNKLSISIQDKGIGMDADARKHIFEKFYRAHSGNVHDVKGYGLGMSYVKWVIDSHKGVITVHSEVGIGTAIEIILPI
ncbi:MAG: HAMP domain-containing sensor histidine kinase [Bacteroidetes bacterium]|jgi:two-component system phosphate regulon sensor histidine kinase PhoR|nr:HAMP domain-containing sensor histidine kinase [Bacteroidota bacterium]